MACGESPMNLYKCEFTGLLVCWTCQQMKYRQKGEQLILRGLMCQVFAVLTDGQFRVTEHGPMVYTGAEKEVSN